MPTGGIIAVIPASLSKFGHRNRDTIEFTAAQLHKIGRTIGGECFVNSCIAIGTQRQKRDVLEVDGIGGMHAGRNRFGRNSGWFEHWRYRSAICIGCKYGLDCCIATADQRDWVRMIADIGGTTLDRRNHRRTGWLDELVTFCP